VNVTQLTLRNFMNFQLLANVNNPTLCAERVERERERESAKNQSKEVKFLCAGIFESEMCGRRRILLPLRIYHNNNE
jgi:hypothetical protein